MEIQGEYDTLVGLFTGNGEKACMLVNYTDPIRKCTSRVTLNTGDIRKLRLYQDGKQTLLQPENGQVTVVLEPGNCGFVVW